MQALFLGIITATISIAAIEALKLNRRTIGALILVGIGFVYIGFAPTEFPAVVFESLQAIAFLLIAYYGLTKYKNLIWIGLVLHALWDGVHLLIQASFLPNGYEVFCITVDMLFAIYFYLKLKK